MTEVALDHLAESRLQQLGLSGDLLTRVLLRADAEAKMTSALEPPTAEGTTRYNKTVGVLREELLPLGWNLSNAKNFCRTIHPSGAFSIVVSSGDEFTGVALPGMKPSTKYRKGELTALAVARNADQGVLDLGLDFEVEAADAGGLETFWFLLSWVTGDEIFAELSLPTAIEDGVIVDWQERLILPHICRRDPWPTITVEEPPEEDGGPYSVDVAIR